jgi:uncharacterized membrane protein
MRYWLITIVSVLLAIGGWWALYQLTGELSPADSGATSLFFVLLFVALTATLAPAAAYLNRRFAPDAVRRDPWRFLRHSIWAGLCLTAWAWLQLRRVFSPGFALVIPLIFVALELLIVRLRAEGQASRALPDGAKRRPDAAKRAAAGARRKPPAG